MDPAICLALAIYFEARSEPVIGQLAVATVVLNRVKSPRWPDDICKVVWQRKQFSFTHDGKSDRPKEKIAWKRSRMLADVMLNTATSYDFSKGSDHYHTKQVKPYWVASLDQKTVIGNHIFYGKKNDTK